MNSVATVLKEQFKNFYLIQRIAQFELKIANHDNYLGLAWEMINPIVQIGVYWFVFGLGIRGGREMEGVPFILWLLVGISMWFFINQGILEGTKSIAIKYNLVSKMNFPLSTIPSFTLMSKFYSHITLLILIILLCFISGVKPSVHLIQLFIYVPYVYIFCLSVTLLTSTLGVIIKDVQMAVQALLRVLFYLSPILWYAEGTGSTMELVRFIMKLNPIYFLAESYRAAILYHNWYFIEHWQLTLYNLIICIGFFVIGSIVHMKFRHRYSDFM